MVNIKKRVVSGKTYYYLEHSIREDGKITNKTKYLGDSIPTNIENLKKEFMLELYKEKWFSDFEKIKLKYQKEQKIMPISARVKEKQTFAVKFTYNTQRIEGSTLSLKETANLLERGVTPNEKSMDDVLEAETHKKVFFENIAQIYLESINTENLINYYLNL